MLEFGMGNQLGHDLGLISYLAAVCAYAADCSRCVRVGFEGARTCTMCRDACMRIFLHCMHRICTELPVAPASLFW